MNESITATSALPAKLPAVTLPGKSQTQEGRILAALGLIRGPLPQAVMKWLIRYHNYLAAHLRLPFEARCPEDSGVLRPWSSNVTVVELLTPSSFSTNDGMGLKCKAFRGGEATEIPLVDLEVLSDALDAQLIEDYWYWFWNWQFDPRI
jgi:hypothetical protein